MLLCVVFGALLGAGVVGITWLVTASIPGPEPSPLQIATSEDHLRRAWLLTEEQPEKALRHAESAVQLLRKALGRAA